MNLKRESDKDLAMISYSIPRTDCRVVNRPLNQVEIDDLTDNNGQIKVNILVENFEHINVDFIEAAIACEANLISDVKWRLVTIVPHTQEIMISVVAENKKMKD